MPPTMRNGTIIFWEMPPRANVALPTTSCEMDVHAYADTICAIMDVPVYEGATVESLHVLFTLYSEFKNNSHFAS